MTHFVRSIKYEEQEDPVMEIRLREDGGGGAPGVTIHKNEEACFFDDENILKRDSGIGYTTL